MNTSNLMHVLQEYQQLAQFKYSVTARDALPRVASVVAPHVIILNTASASEPGEHWLGIVVLNESCYFIDSLGHAPDHYGLTSYLKSLKPRNCFWFSRSFQHHTTNVCGAFCCFVVLLLLMSIPFSEIGRMFVKQNSLRSDTFMHAFIVRSFPSIRFAFRD